MDILNVEWKARVHSIDPYEERLLQLHPRFAGLDHQVDTYFRVSTGRLKLREGNIENALIHYDREDQPDARRSSVILYRCTPDPALKQILALHLGERVVVDKQRKIYFLDNVKFHFDRVAGLGAFVEVEAISQDGRFSEAELDRQCRHYAEVLGIPDGAYVRESYSDLIEKISR
jgi:predicted adenylyl cyclase CyaB